MHNITKIFCVGVLTLQFAVGANAQNTQYAISTSYVSEYVDRGATVSGQQNVLFLGVADGGFSASVSYARTLGDDRLVFGDEIDINLDYGFEVGTFISANIGADIVNDPRAGALFDFGSNDASTIEIYTGLSFEAPFAPSLTTFYDLHLKDFTVEAAAEQSIPLSSATEFSIGLTGGYAAIARGDDNFYLASTLALNHALSKNLTAFSQISGGISTEDTFLDISTNTLTVSQSHSNIWFEIGLKSEF